MRPDTVIRSRANPELKRVGAVRAGKEKGVLVLEGDRLVDEALDAGLEMLVVLVAESRDERARELEARDVPVRRASDDVLAHASGLVTSPGILALCSAPAAPDRASLAPEARALVLVVCGVADPGNLGALARSAEAAGARALCTVGEGAGPWSEKALRGSMGSLLRLPVHRYPDAPSALADLPDHRHVRAATRGGTPHARFGWTGPVALWIGPETGRLPAECDVFEAVSIPMSGGAESLNVTVAASVLLFASGRAEVR